MAVEMPEPVAAAEGAEPVIFPWTQATEAVAALNAAATTLSGQCEARADEHPTLAEWRGGYRDEFDVTYQGVMTEAAGLQETLLTRAGAIADAAVAANELQAARNTKAAAVQPLG
jgi:uncharacterized protein YukE